MGRLKVIEWPAKVLETRAEDVTEFDAELAQLVRDMHATMDFDSGIGLAANQVNVLKRIFTIYIPFQEANEDGPGDSERLWWHDKRFTFINPVITKKDGRVKAMEGCLSFPDIFDYVDRAERVSVQAFDEKGQEFNVDADGLLAICIQHELDHIDGIVFINRMSRLKSQMARKKMQKRQMAKAQPEV